MSIKDAQERIIKTVTSGKGVTAQPHRFGGVEYTIGPAQAATLMRAAFH